MNACHQLPDRFHLHHHHPSCSWQPVVGLSKQVTPRAQNAVLEVLVDVNTLRVAFVNYSLLCVHFIADSVAYFVVKVPLVRCIILQDLHSLGDSFVHFPQADDKSFD